MELRPFSAKSSPPPPPPHLKAAGAKLWADLTREYVVRDGAGLALVTAAAEALDRQQEAREAIDKYGAVVVDRYGNPKANPACHIERDARAGFLACLKALNLDLEPLRDGRGRPPTYA